MTTTTLRVSALSRTPVRILLIIVAVMAVLLYLEWRSARAAPDASSDVDTMCIASRIGLSCRS